MKRLCALLFALVAAADLAAAETIPLPRPRPEPLAEGIVPTPAPGAAPSACRLRMVAKRAIAPGVDPIEGPGACGGTDMVRLEAIVLPDNSRVEMSPPAVLRCSMAEAIVDWVTDDLAPLAKSKLGSPLRSIRNFAAYHCRTRNNIVGASMSEHARGNALDIRSVTLVSGRIVDPTDMQVAKQFRDGWRTSVCTRFSTVLGPGSDGHHENHIHVDLMRRRSGYRAMCRWDIRMPEAAAPALAGSSKTVPLPLPRPKIEKTKAPK